jgi:LysR family tcuABC transcriptional regulator
MRYFARVVELGSMGRAAAEIGVGTSALSQQISRLEGELATRLLTRTATGVVPTDAGLAFLHQAQLALRHANDAIQAARRARLSGHVCIGLGSSIAAVIGVPFIKAMQSRYPDIRLKLVENLSGNLSTMLGTRQLDLCVAFDSSIASRGSVIPLLEERLFLMGHPDLPGLPVHSKATIAEISELPLIMPAASHHLRALVDGAFARAQKTPRIVLEMDGFALLMEAVRAGLGATIQPGAAMVRVGSDQLVMTEIDEPNLFRRTMIASLSDEEMSLAGLAARQVLAEVARETAVRGQWPGTRLIAPAR